jgi:hypothetical protein
MEKLLILVPFGTGIFNQTENMPVPFSLAARRHQLADAGRRDVACGHDVMKKGTGIFRVRNSCQLNQEKAK